MSLAATSLRFQRIKDARLIPPDLIKNVKGTCYTPEDFYLFQETQVLGQNPYNFLFALVDKEGSVQGYIWMQTNPLDKSLFVNTFSISRDYWGRGEAIDLVVESVKGFKKVVGAERVLWMTTNPRFFGKKGFKQSKNFLMEFVE